MPKKIKLPLDLGREFPSVKGLSIEATSDHEREKHYPSVVFEWEKPYNLPESGTITLKFKRTSETNSKGKGGKQSQRVELDLLSIEGVKAEKGEVEEEDEESTGDILDKAKEKIESDEDY